MWSHRRTSSVAFDVPQTDRHSSVPASTLEPTISVNSESPLVENVVGRSRVSSVPSSYVIGRSNSPAASPNDEVAIEEEPYASTFYSLQKWSTVAKDRQRKIDERLKRKLHERRARSEEKEYDTTYQQLLCLVNRKPPSMWERFLSVFRRAPSPPEGSPQGSEAEKKSSGIPSKEKLVELAKHCYPPRFSARAFVIDFGDGYSECTSVEVGNIEETWRTKPSWSLVRWIHVPFGRGVVHSSIEDIFLHEHPVRRPFTHAGEAAWPFLQTESLNFRSWAEFKRMRDVYLLLSENEELGKALAQATFESAYPDTYLEKDMRWRASHIGTTLDYWDLVQSDIPFKMSEGGGLSEAMLSNYQYCMMGPRDGLQKLELDEDDDDTDSEKEEDESDDKITQDFYGSFLKRNKQKTMKTSRDDKTPAAQRKKEKKIYKKNRQALVKHPYFKGSQLVRNDFRAFHGDEYLLTMSAASGVDFLDTEFQHYLRISGKNRLLNPDATCIGRLAARFSETGCKNWHRKTAEWLLVHLITEIGTAPNPFNMGMVAPTLGEAYQAVVLDLNRRRYDKWQRNETVQLVRDMLACGDELNVLVTVYGKRARLFRGLLQDCKKMESEDLRHTKIAPNGDGESSVERVTFALRLAEEEFNCFNRLLGDIRGSLSALFHLRSIEQDELTKSADKQQRAVLVFTCVTIVFLPLSFFTSYFGMNLSDITTKERPQGYFWEVCGSVALIIVISVLLFGYRHHFHWRKRIVWNHSQMGKQRSWYTV